MTRRWKSVLTLEGEHGKTYRVQSRVVRVREHGRAFDRLFYRAEVVEAHGGVALGDFKARSDAMAECERHDTARAVAHV